MGEGLNDLEDLLNDLGDTGEDVGTYEVEVDAGIDLDPDNQISDLDLLAELQEASVPAGSMSVTLGEDLSGDSDDDHSAFGLKLETGDTAEVPSSSHAKADAEFDFDLGLDDGFGNVHISEAVETPPAHVTSISTTSSYSAPSNDPPPVLFTLEVPSRSPSFAAPSTTTTTVITTTTTQNPSPKADTKVIRAPSVTYTPPMPQSFDSVRNKFDPEPAAKSQRNFKIQPKQPAKASPSPAPKPAPTPAPSYSHDTTTASGSVFTPSLPVYQDGSGYSSSTSYSSPSSSSGSSNSGYSVPLSTGNNATYNYNTTSPGVTTVLRVDAPSAYCDTCHQPITAGQPQLRALGKIYHKDHFVCRKCNSSIGDTPFVPVGGVPYCQSCYGTQDAPSCDRCRNTITRGTTFLRALGGVYHPACFTCVRCNVALNPEQFYVKDNTKATCKNCYTLV